MNSSDLIQITVNGDTRQVAGDCTVTQLLADMALAGKRIAVERNLEIVPRTLHASTVLQDQDVLEIVQAIGGG
nr:sulfur carrier protein ThiS [Ketobacter sp. MCCC 1A13808]